MNGCFRRRGPGFLAAILPAALLIVTGANGEPGAKDLTAFAPTTNTIALESRQTDYPVQITIVDLAVQSTPFPKEPTSSGKVVRGTLNFGGVSNAISFLWQRDAGTLFLDRNHNQDLTDDPAGALSARAKESARSQTFTNAQLIFTTPAGQYPLRADLNIWDYSSRPGCSAALHSFWQGKLTLAGQDWQVGLVPNILLNADSCEGDQMLLRPWSDRNKPFNATGSSFEAFPFSQKLFFNGHAYQVGSQFHPRNSESSVTLQFIEQPVALGELKITGQFIRRLMLPGSNSWLVIFDHPAATEKIPVGDYQAPNVLLSQNGVEASATVARWPTKKSFSVDGKTSAILNAGGPLTNSVTATRHGSDLRLDYQLIGAGGQIYQLVAQNRSQPPQFAVFTGDKQIASGNFEFG